MQLLDYMNFRAREEEPPPPPTPPELDKDGKPKKKRVPKAEPPPPLDPLAALKEFEEKEEVIPKVVLPPLEESTANVHSIWDFQCDVTDGRNISCMTWNKVNNMYSLIIISALRTWSNLLVLFSYLYYLELMIEIDV